MSTTDQFFRYAGCTTLAASMFLAACGGSDAPTVATGGTGGQANPDTPAPTVPVTPVVQPAWASMGVLVAPGQESKVLNLTMCGGEGTNISGDLFNASLTVMANGDVSFKAARTASGTPTELFAMQQSATTSRDFRVSSANGALTSIEYIGNNANQSSTVSIKSDRSIPFIASFPSTGVAGSEYIYCRSGADIASLTPAAAFLPSEARAASGFFAGVTGIVQDGSVGPSYDASIRDGVFFWLNNWKTAPAQDRLGSSVNLTNGQLFNGSGYTSSTGFAASPAPERVVFSSALQGGSYRENYRAARGETPEFRSIELQILNSMSSAYYFLLRQGTLLSVND
jgi:hypothetical protein